MHTIVELPEYQLRASKLLSGKERGRVVSFLAEHPESGILLKGTGGIRKLRWSGQGRDKSGGVRVIYLYHNEAVPLFLLTVFGKGQRANISKGERNNLAKNASLIIRAYRESDE